MCVILVYIASFWSFSTSYMMFKEAISKIKIMVNTGTKTYSFFILVVLYKYTNKQTRSTKIRYSPFGLICATNAIDKDKIVISK